MSAPVPLSWAWAHAAALTPAEREQLLDALTTRLFRDHLTWLATHAGPRFTASQPPTPNPTQPRTEVPHAAHHPPT
jgi:hypothetical protein